MAVASLEDYEEIALKSTGDSAGPNYLRPEAHLKFQRPLEPLRPKSKEWLRTEPKTSKTRLMNSSQPKAAGDVGAFQIGIVILSLVLLCALAIDTLFQLPREVQSVIQIADTAICGILLTDFFVRLYRAESKLAFMKWGWMLGGQPQAKTMREKAPHCLV